MNINEHVEDYELNQHIAQGCLTNSKHPDRFVGGVYPQIVTHGHKSHLYSLDGTKYLDFICGLGTNLFGYGNKKIRDFVAKGMFKGECHSLPTKWEVIASRQIKECFPWIEKVKFLNDGSSACTASIIMARAYQKYFASECRSVVLSEGYHGWHNEFTSLTPPSNGVLKHSKIKPLSALNKMDPSRIGAIIIEPVILDDSTVRQAELKFLREFCTQNDIVLIFDETITALRYPKLSVANYFGIHPDLIIFGKAMANGEKISCVAGKSSILEGEYFVSGTYHGHVPSLMATSACLHMAKHDSDYDLVKLKGDGDWFMEEFNKRCEGHISLEGYGTRGVFKGNEMSKALFWQEMCKANILFGPSFFLNWDHLPYLKDVLYLTERIMDKINTGVVGLEGKAPTSPFSSKARS